MSNFNSKILKIDSSKVTRYLNVYKTAFQFVLEPSISVHPNKSIVYSVVNVNIPYSFYSVNSNNNYLDVEEKINNVTSRRTVIIPSGNYNAYDFSKIIMAVLNNSTITYSIQYNKNSNTYYTAISSPQTATSVFLFNTGPNKLKAINKFLGIPNEDVLINNVPFSTGLITMNDIYYFQLKSDIGLSDNIITADGNDGILEIIPINDQPLNFISFNPINPNKFLLHSSTLNIITFALFDNYNRIVDLNNIPFFITIKIDIVDNMENNIMMGKGRTIDTMESSVMTNLEYIMTHPEAIMRPSDQPPLNLSDMIEYNIIKEMLNKVNSKKYFVDKKLSERKIKI